ncbi:aspartate aminotransferase [Archaeoglobales archaeon]|nr:MAG: aspartate aminotransferase [Archaeoglobales archaeon]
MEALRVSQISTSMIRRMFEIVEKAKKEGKDVVSLTIGEPDFDTDGIILKKAYEAMGNGYTHYTSNFGLDELREAIASKYKLDANNVMITAGGSEALLNASLAFIERGSKVVIPSPSFLSYFTYTKLCEAKTLQILTHENNFEVDVDELNEIMDKDVSMIFLNYPNNPTGAIMDEKDLKAIVEIAKDYNTIVLSDEIYDSIYYDKKPTTLAGYENTIVINGFSKSLAMTGWRIGYVIANDELMDSMLKIHQVNGVCAPAFTQKAVASVIAEEKDKEITQKMIKEFRKRRDFVYKRLKSKFDIIKPEGAFYFFVKVNEDCMEFVEKALDKGVALTPGIPFGDGNEEYVRISYATSLENLEKAMDRLEKL